MFRSLRKKFLLSSVEQTENCKICKLDKRAVLLAMKILYNKSLFPVGNIIGIVFIKNDIFHKKKKKNEGLRTKGPEVVSFAERNTGSRSQGLEKLWNISRELVGQVSHLYGRQTGCDVKVRDPYAHETTFPAGETN